MGDAKIYVIVPAYNEQAMLRSTISSLLTTGYTIVVIDDGSSTDQSALLTGLPIHFLRHRMNLGQGAALQTGNNYALQQGARIIVHFDSDGQHQTSDIDQLLVPILSNEFDVTLGSRFLIKHQPTTISFFRKSVLHAARYLNYFLTGLLLSDAHNGLRAMNRSAAQQLVLNENRMAHASEILFLLKKNKLRFKEVPVTINYTHYSKQKGQSSWNSIRIFFDLLLHKLFE